MNPGTKLIEVGSVIGSDKAVYFKDIETQYLFWGMPGGTLLTVTQKHLPVEKTVINREIIWDQCLDNLESLFSSEIIENAS